MKIAISGSNGLIGSALVEALSARGDEITRLARDQVPDLSTQDAVINLAGASIAGRPWTKRYKQEILNSRLTVTKNIVEALNHEAKQDHQLIFLSGSAVGFYGSRTSEELTENSLAGSGFLAEVVKQWEAAAAKAADLHRTVLLRTGHVFATHGGILGPQRLLYSAGLGGPISNGTQYMPWIMIDDYTRAVMHLLDNPDAHGPINMTSPNPVRQRDFAEAFARSLGRSAKVKTPIFAPKLLLGQEMVNELLLASQNAVPQALMDLGFTFQHTEIGPALIELEGLR